ncbi:hypothetical protein FACS1894187_02620 [Synergistales bacterium]|nr:hypothetical protein FACS1894187_02620 [Synergistales bacterium]
MLEKVEINPSLPPTIPMDNKNEENEKTKKKKTAVNMAGIEAFRTIVNEKNGTVSYKRKSERFQIIPSFKQAQDSIKIFKTDDDTLLAAMQIAHNQWGAINIKGKKEHLDKCWKIIEEYNKDLNPRDQIKAKFPNEYLKEREIAKKQEREIEQENGIYKETTKTKLIQTENQIKNNIANNKLSDYDETEVIKNPILKETQRAIADLENSPNDRVTKEKSVKSVEKNLEASLDSKKIEEGYKVSENESLTEEHGHKLNKIEDPQPQKEDPIDIAKSIFGPFAPIGNAQKNQTYTGNIIRIGKNYAIQKTDTKVVIHDLSKISNDDFIAMTDIPKNTRHISISYDNNNNANLKIRNQSKEQESGFSRELTL